MLTVYVHLPAVVSVRVVDMKLKSHHFLRSAKRGSHEHHPRLDGPTEGCVALHLPDLLQVLRWLDPADYPVIEIGTDAEAGHVPPAPA